MVLVERGEASPLVVVGSMRSFAPGPTWERQGVSEWWSVAVAAVASGSMAGLVQAFDESWLDFLSGCGGGERRKKARKASFVASIASFQLPRGDFSYGTAKGFFFYVGMDDGGRVRPAHM